MSVIMSEKNEKRNTVLKDIEGKPMEFDLAYDPYVGTAEEVRGLARARGDLMYENPKAAIREQGTQGFNEPEEDWKETMAENRKAYEKKYKEKISKYPGNVIFGAKAPAVQSPTLPESVAYLDGTMPRKVAKPTAEQTQAQTPAVKEETPVSVAQATATEAVSQKEEMPTAQSRYDKAIAYINEASKSPSWRERRDIRKMEEAAKKEGLIEAGKKRIETEPIAWETDLEEVEIIGDKKPTPEKTAPKKEAPVAQTPAPAVKTAVEDGGKKTIPLPERPEMEKGNYFEQTDAQIAQSLKTAAEQEERNAKRDRDMAILSDITNLVTMGAAIHGGAWKIKPTQGYTESANKRIRDIKKRQRQELLRLREQMQKQNATNIANELKQEQFNTRMRQQQDQFNTRMRQQQDQFDRRIKQQQEQFDKRMQQQTKNKRANDTYLIYQPETRKYKEYPNIHAAYYSLPQGYKAVKIYLDNTGKQLIVEDPHPTVQKMQQMIDLYNYTKENGIEYDSFETQPFNIDEGYSRNETKDLQTPTYNPDGTISFKKVSDQPIKIRK